MLHGWEVLSRLTWTVVPPVTAVEHNEQFSTDLISLCTA